MLDAPAVVAAFNHYTKAEGHPVSAADFQLNLATKLAHPAFLSDTPPLLRPGVHYDSAAAQGVAAVQPHPLAALIPASHEHLRPQDLRPRRSQAAQGRIGVRYRGQSLILIHKAAKATLLTWSAS